MNVNSLKAEVIEILIDLGLISKEDVPEELEVYTSIDYKPKPSIISDLVIE